MKTASSKLGNRVLAASTRTEEGWLVLSEQDDDDDDEEEEEEEEEEEGHCSYFLDFHQIVAGPRL